VAWWLRRRSSVAVLALCGLIAGSVVAGVFWVHLGVSRRRSVPRARAAGAVASSPIRPSGHSAAARWSRCDSLTARPPRCTLSGRRGRRRSSGATSMRSARSSPLRAPLCERRTSPRESPPHCVCGAWKRSRGPATCAGCSATCARGRARASTQSRARRCVARQHTPWPAVAGRGQFVGSGHAYRGACTLRGDIGYHVMLLAGLVEWRSLRRSWAGDHAVSSGGAGGCLRPADGRQGVGGAQLGMGAVAGIAHSTGRRGNGLSALALTAVLFLCLTPSAVFDIGFQMSVLGIGGILLFARLAEDGSLPRCRTGLAWRRRR